MAIGFLRGALDWFAKLGLTVRDDAPKIIDVASREWGEPAAGVALSIRELPKEDPDQLPGISAALRNVSGEKKRLEISPWLLFYSVSIARPDGAPAALTAFGREQLKPERHAHGLALDLDPGQAVETEIPLGSLYGMRSPGDYRIALSAQLPTGEVAQSNEITLSR
ncbi:MAG TPA: hypothetical protein VG345_07520 [Bryobacteraceae bacterium]|nr:hypothetical protein [Bryobacteraceae bacterium]